MTRLMFFSLFVCYSFFCLGQATPIKITYQQEANHQISFYADNSTFVPYTVSITFTRLSNTLTHAEGSTFHTLVKRGTTRLTTLRPINADSGIGFAYQSKYTKGDPTLKPDTNFTRWRN